jgi:preprotein translocase subunit Sec61beta
MANQFASCLGELADCQSTESGTPCVAKIGTQEVAAVILDDPFNPTILDGGTSQSGQQIVMVDKALLTSFAGYPNGQPPINITPTLVLGVSAFVIGVNEAQGVLKITTGYPAAEDN